MHPEAQPLLVADRYALFEEFATGGMAAIHLGRQLGAVGFARTVAIKRLHPHLARDPEFVAMFVDEAVLAARIRHPNVVTTLDVVQHDGELLLVMEYIDGESLTGVLKAGRRHGEPIPVDVASRVVCDVLAGLHAAHDAVSESGAPLHIVHRDVSPSNVLVGSDGVSRVLDFGVAKAAVRVSSTRQGGIKGKLHYMAPEQISDHEVSRRTDVYAACVVLWELLAGEPLFRASNEAALMSRIVEGRVSPPSRKNASISPAVDEVILRGLARAPDMRFPTAQHLALALEAVLPPASNHRTAEWVTRVAAAPLRARRALVARVEGNRAAQANVPSAIPSAPERTETAPHRVVPMEHAAGSDGHRAQAHTAVIAATDILDGPTLLATARRPAREDPWRPRAWAPWLAGTAVVSGGAIAFALTLGRAAPDPAAPVTPSTAEVNPRAPDAPSAGGEDEDDSGTATTIEPAPSAIGATAAPSAPTAASSRPSPRKRPLPGPAAKAGKPSCDPPYTIDAQGRRRAKRECL